MTDGIYQRGGVWWSSYSHRGKEIRESVKKVTGKNTEAAAKQRRKERVRTAGTPGFVDPTRARRLTFDDLASMYLTDYRISGNRSARDAASYVETLREPFGLEAALNITTDRIAAYTEPRLALGRKPATVNRELAALRHMFSLAVRAGKLSRRPHIAMLVEENVREGFIDPPEFSRLLDHLRGQ